VIFEEKKRMSIAIEATLEQLKQFQPILLPDGKSVIAEAFRMKKNDLTCSRC